MESIYDEYVFVQKEIEALEAKKEALREKISAELPEEGIKTERLTAVWKTVKKWKYSGKVDELTQQLKDQKKEEEEKGVAEVVDEKKQLAITVK